MLGCTLLLHQQRKSFTFWDGCLHETSGFKVLPQEEMPDILGHTFQHMFWTCMASPKKYYKRGERGLAVPLQILTPSNVPA